MSYITVSNIFCRKVATICVGLLAIVSSLTAYTDSGAEHQTAQAWPISLGCSGGNILDKTSMYCCSGTLGSSVKDANGTLYILSNNHVLARSNQAALGEDVNHPGMIDQNCGTSGVVADLSKFVTLKFKSGRSVPLNTVDAAIAQIRSGAVRTDGFILDIGTLSANTVGAFVGQAVQKSGRTTGYTVGSVAAVNVTVDVGYSKSCGGAANQVARFVNQIRITPGSFSAGGDSGSLIVEAGTVDPNTGKPRAVGLLFAGSSSSTLANPISSVLSSLGVSMVGQTGAALASTTSQPTAEAQRTALATATAVKERNSARLFAVPGVIGHGATVDDKGNPVIEVYVAADNAARAQDVPKQLEGVSLRTVVTDRFVAF